MADAKYIIACNIGAYESTPEWEWIVVTASDHGHMVSHTKIEANATDFPSLAVAVVWRERILKDFGYAFRALMVQPVKEKQ